MLLKDLLTYIRI